MNSEYTSPSFSEEKSYLMGFRPYENGNLKAGISCPEQSSVDFSGLNDPQFNPSKFVKSTINKLQTNKSAATLANSYCSPDKENFVTHYSEKNLRSDFGSGSYSTFSMIESPKCNRDTLKRKFGRLVSPKTLHIISPSRKSKLVVKPCNPMKSPIRTKKSTVTEISPGKVTMKTFLMDAEGKRKKRSVITVYDKQSDTITTTRDSNLGLKKIVNFTKCIGPDKITVVSERKFDENGKCSVVTRTIISKSSTFDLHHPR